MKKKIIMILTFAMLATSNVIPVFALDGPGNNSYPEDENRSCCSIGEEIPIDEEQSAYYSMLGSISPRATEDITITGIPNYYQSGNYAHLNGCSTETIDSAGCALVSFAMVGHKYNSEVTVESVNNYGAMGSNCSFQWSSTASHFGLKLDSVGASSQKESEQKTIIKGLLRDGYAAIVGLRKVGTTDRHFVVVYRYVSNSSGEVFYLKNPSKYGATTLDGYMANWYIEYVYKLYK